jgi:hypothetical protein
MNDNLEYRRDVIAYQVFLRGAYSDWTSDHPTEAQAIAAAQKLRETLKPRGDDYRLIEIRRVVEEYSVLPE